MKTPIVLLWTIASLFAGSASAEGEIEIAADVVDEAAIAAEVARLYPHIDLATTHNVRAIEDPKEPEQRNAYTRDMVDVVKIWVSTGQGATLEKLIDAQLAEQPHNAVLAFVAGYFSLHYPLVLDKTSRIAEEYYRRAIKLVSERNESFAYAQAYLAEYLARSGGRLAEVRELIDQAVASLPNDPNMLLLQATVYNMRVSSDTRVAGSDAISTVCRRILDLDCANERVADATLDIYAEASIGRDDAYTSWLEQAYAAKPQGAWKARIASRLAEISIRNRDYGQALELGDEALEAFKCEEHPALAMDILERVHLSAVGKLAFAAEQDNRDRDAIELYSRLEGHYRDWVEIDLAHLPWSAPRKVASAIEFANFLVTRGRQQDALAMLDDYGKRAKLLTGVQRDRLERAILAARQIAGLLSPETWPALSDKELEALWDSLKREVIESLRTREKLAKFADTKAFDFFIEKAKNNTSRSLANSALWLALGSALALEDEEAHVRLRETIDELLGRETDISNRDQKTLISTCLSVVAQLLPQIRGCETILAYLDNLGAAGTYESGIFSTGMNAVLRAAGLDDSFKPGIGDRGLDGYKLWSRRVRDQLAKRASEPPPERMPPDEAK